MLVGRVTASGPYGWHGEDKDLPARLVAGYERHRWSSAATDDPSAVKEDDVANGKAAIRSIFSKQQRAFYAAHAPDGLKLKDLSVLGPIFVLKQNFTPPELARRLTAELWFYPDGSRILELSTKCTAADAFQVAAEARSFLTEKGVSLNGRQETKTKAALTFFSKQLQAAAAA